MPHDANVATTIPGGDLSLMPNLFVGIVKPPGQVVEVEIIGKLAAPGHECVGIVTQQSIVKVEAVMLGHQQMLIGLRIENDVWVKHLPDVDNGGAACRVKINIAHVVLIEVPSQCLDIACLLFDAVVNTWRDDDVHIKSPVISKQLVEVLILPHGHAHGQKHHTGFASLANEVNAALLCSLGSTILPQMKIHISTAVFCYV